MAHGARDGYHRRKQELKIANGEIEAVDDAREDDTDDADIQD